ncbi:hypothetical protein [Streptomyces sp. NPDC050560]|uniref:hypothetical protein n=1 Tax=Streptomyces sp. NPDC050560 TaxID=3365630 RepID=UPI00379CF71B
MPEEHTPQQSSRNAVERVVWRVRAAAEGSLNNARAKALKKEVDAQRQRIGSALKDLGRADAFAQEGRDRKPAGAPETETGLMRDQAQQDRHHQDEYWKTLETARKHGGKRRRDWDDKDSAQVQALLDGTAPLWGTKVEWVSEKELGKFVPAMALRDLASRTAADGARPAAADESAARENRGPDGPSVAETAAMPLTGGGRTSKEKPTDVPLPGHGPHQGSQGQGQRRGRAPRAR